MKLSKEFEELILKQLESFGCSMGVTHLVMYLASAKQGTKATFEMIGQWPQINKLLKSLEKTKRAIENKGLKVYDYGWEWTDYAYFWFKTDKKLSVIKKHYGPKVDMKVHLKKFKKKWKSIIGNESY